MDYIPDDYVEVNGVFVRGTGLSILFEDADGKEHWLPRSLIHMSPEDPDSDDPITVSLPEWKAVQEGLI